MTTTGIKERTRYPSIHVREKTRIREKEAIIHTLEKKEWKIMYQFEGTVEF